MPSHVGLHGNEKADGLADKGEMLHGVPIKGKEKEMTSMLKRKREEFKNTGIGPHSSVGERLAGDRDDMGSNTSADMLCAPPQSTAATASR